MRLHALWLLLATGTASAAQLEVSVTQNSQLPQVFTYELGDDRVSLDLRDSHRYPVAVKDVKRGKEICRDAEYRTGMLITLRKLDDGTAPTDGMKVELVGQISELQALEKKEVLSCGQNTSPVLVNKAFSDTSVIEPSRPKAIVVDGKTTVVLSIKQ